MRLLTGTLLLAREPLRLSLMIAERGFSGAASVARIALEILGEPTREADAGAPFTRPERAGADGGPPAPDVEPEVDVLAPEPGERGPEPDVLAPEPEVPQPSTLETEPAAPAPEPAAVEPDPAIVEPEPSVVEPEPAAPGEPERVDEAAVHVDEEPVLVADVAEQGAEEGAGAEVHVEEPWEGYDAMTAGEIRSRLADAEPEVAAAVKLYETTRKERTSVLEAADRRLGS